MTLTCALCSRPLLSAAVLIDTLPVGPFCARKSGLVKLARERRGLVRPGPALKSAMTREERRQYELQFSEAA
jgi:hypothetical protein